MRRHSLHAIFTLGVSLLAVAACSERPEVRRSVARVQQAVGEGAQGALSERPTQARPRLELDTSGVMARAPGLVGATPPSADPGVSPASTLPRLHAVGEGVAFDSDRNHQDVATALSGQQLGVAWHDGEGMWFAAADAHGRPVAPPVELRVLAGDEEALSPPSVVVAGDAFGVAWVDAANGRVRFQMVGADGSPRGASTIVHEGLDDPRSAQLVFNGREFGLAARLREGVYFARVDLQGHRLDAGQLFAEGEPVDAVDAVRWDGHGYSLDFSVAREGRVERREQRISQHRVVALHAAGAPAGSRWM